MVYASFDECTQKQNYFEKDFANIYLFKVTNTKTRARCEICSKLTMKTSEQHKLGYSGAFIVNFEHISHIFFGVSIVYFEQVHVCRELCFIQQEFHLYQKGRGG